MKTRGTYTLGSMALVTVLLELSVWAIMLSLWWYLKKEVPAFRFEHPERLWGMFLGPIMVMIFLADIAWRNRALGRFASSATLYRMVPGVSSTRSVVRFLFVRHGLGCVILALASPQFGTRPNTVKAEGIDLMIAVDVSNSMLCEDIAPSRIEVAKRGISQILDRMRGDRIGIVIFAGRSFVQLPLTADRSAAKMFLADIGPGNISTQGTAIGDAIDMALRSFDTESPTGKAIVVITDGENFEDDAIRATQNAASEKVVVHTLGAGSPEGGPIPIRRKEQTLGFKKASDGTTVITKLNEPLLREIAQVGNGIFVRASNGSTGMDQIIDQLKTMQKTEMGTYQYTAHEDQFQYPLALGILLIGFAFTFGSRSQGLRKMTVGS